MEIAEGLLILATFLYLGDLIQLRNSKIKKLGFPLAFPAGIFIISSYLLLAHAFITNNFRYQSVYYYSSSGLPVLGRLYASWASSAGSWLFLSFLLATAYSMIRYSMRKNAPLWKAFEILDIMMLFFLLIVLFQSPFKVFSNPMIDGRGLNPLLKTPWMLIHPPVVFIGYVFTFISFAFTFDSLNSNQSKNRILVRGSTQLAWLFLSLGIALGGVWAYEVLGWGGYWAWDPVETASLIPWITLTAYFHFTSITSGEESSTKELFIMISSSLVILATAITRGGLTVSVHAFGESPTGFILFTLLGLLAGYFLYEQRKTGKPLFEFQWETSSVYSTSMAMSVLSLIMISLVCLWGLLFPVLIGLMGGDATGVDADFFNKWSYPLVLVYVASLIGCHLHKKLTMKIYTGILGVLVMLGIVGAFLRFPSGNFSVDLGVPLSVFALCVVIYDAFRSIFVLKRELVKTGRSFIHTGVVLIVIGILLSSTSVTDYNEFVITPSSTLELSGVQLEFGDFEIIEAFGNVQTSSLEPSTSEAAGIEIPVTIRDGRNVLKGDLQILFYSVHGVVSKPLVLRSLGVDYYLVLHQTDLAYFSLTHAIVGASVPPYEVVVSVRTLPLMNLIWFGVLLLCAGILFPFSKQFIVN